MSRRRPRPRRAPGRGIEATALLAAGLLLVAGAMLHAHVPATPAEEMATIAGDADWTLTHWVLTFAQLAALPGLLLLAHRWRTGGNDARLLTGSLLLGVGLFVGAVATVTSATLLKEAARSGSMDLFRTAGAFTLGLGWLCLLLVALGGLLLGAHLAGPGGHRRFGLALAAGGALLLVAGVATPPGHPWLHPYVLRGTAALAGLLLAFLGAQSMRAWARGPA